MENRKHDARVLNSARRLDESCLHELFEAQADAQPHAPALLWNDQTVSYEELEQRANRLARHLREQGAGPGRFIGIYLERSEHPIVAILACLKTGAAYVPIDPTCPPDRIRHILTESEAILLLTESSLAARGREVFTGPVIDLDAAAGEIALRSDARISRTESGVAPSDVCYVIYTSGTTGRPKGVMAEHGGAVRYVAAFNAVCGTSPLDRIYQGFALTFDGSVEEIWMAYSNGSALVTGTNETPRFGNELGKFLETSGVTYFSTVPTLLSTITDEVASLKTVVVSGEVCPNELVTRWARPGLRLLNVYGPTEATVNTTAAECVAGRPVTIGKPLPGYALQILGENLEPVARGEKGELFVGGPTLARGYLNQPAMTDERFVTIGGERLYRTGDLVRWNEDGELEFFGRMDGQVKIRGYRVELAEIESIILETVRVRAAAVRLIEQGGLQELAAYVTLDSEQALDRAEILARLEARVPPYMVPGTLDVLPEMPRLASGKIDKKSLPAPQSPLIRAAQAGKTVVQPATELEKRIAAVWARVLSLPEISVTDDFFLDLGGHSLVAARMVTILRKETNRRTTVRDAYGFPTVRKLAAHLELIPEVGAPGAASEGAAPLAPSSREVFESTPAPIRLLTAALQAVSIVFIYGLVSLPFGVLFLKSLAWYRGELSLAGMLAWGFGLSLAVWPALLSLALAAKWLIIGRYQEGRFPLWSFTHFRHWLAGRFIAMSGAGILAGTPLLPVYLRLMGARVGRGCLLDTASFSAFDLLSIGDDTSIGADTQVPGYRVEGGMFILGRAEIGSRCFIGIHSALGLNVKMADDSLLDDQSLLPDGQTIGANECHRGSPAQPGEVRVPEGDRTQGSRAFGRPVLFGLVQLAAVELMTIAGLLPALPFLALYYQVFTRAGAAAGTATLLLSIPVGVVVACLWVVVLKKAILPSVKPGVYAIDSALYLRKWLSDLLMKSTRAALLPVYTTIYLPPWLRLLGARIGKRAELSTVWAFSPELVEVGDESFFADGSIIGGKRLYRGAFELGINRIGRRSFVGNSAILPMGQSLGDNGLLGVQSIPPFSPEARTADGTEWLGSPSFALPNRPKITSFDAATTYQPTAKLYAQRAVIDALRIIIPGTIALCAMVAAVAAFVVIHDTYGLAAFFASIPFVGLALGVASALTVVALKRVVMGPFKPVIVPLWSMYVWLNEMVNGVYESVMAPAIAPFLGTPFIAPFLRAIGCRVGKHAYIESTLFSEWDLVEIGDYAALNAGAIIQTHLFEDRVMKSSSLKIGDECSVGNMAVVLYDTEMQKGSTLAPLSLLMKGEHLAPRTHWYGIPTVQIPEALMSWEKESLRFYRRELPARPRRARAKTAGAILPQPQIAREQLG